MTDFTLGLTVMSVVTVVTVAILAYARIWLPNEMRRRRIGMFRAFGKAVELRSPANRNTTDQVVSLCDEVGKKMGLRPGAHERLMDAAYLRDLGIVAIPYRILNKPMSEWTRAEMAVFEAHPEVSASMLEDIPSLRDLAAIVRMHHQAFDGSTSGGIGLPSGLEIPVEARILRVVTEYVRHSLLEGTGPALARMESQAGTAFCPESLAALKAVLTSARVEFRESAAVA